jgi:hypothetical protein
LQVDVTQLTIISILVGNQSVDVGMDLVEYWTLLFFGTMLQNTLDNTATIPVTEQLISGHVNSKLTDVSTMK